MGRFCMASVPSSSYSPRPRAMRGARKRAVVPELPMNTEARSRGTVPPPPVTSKREPASSRTTSKPSASSAFAMCSVSSLKSAPVSVERPCARAAKMSARLV